VKWRAVAAGIAVSAVGSRFASAAESPAAPSPDAGRPISFVACPLYRDTVRQCWLAEYGGKVYSIGAAGIETLPQLLHQVLVEGVAHDNQASCGAINVSPVHLSVLPEIDTSCNTVLPDNGTSPLDPSRFDAPPEVLSQIGAERPPPSPLASDTRWSIGFDYGSAFLNQVSQQRVETAAKTILASPVTQVTIMGSAAGARLESGQVIIEDAALALRRAEVVRSVLLGLGVSPKSLELRNKAVPTTANGVDDWQRRNVEIEVRIGTRSR
jgi:outer membrane protein OmpA-like peptidoglycan-associated protein